ncbi:NAD-dependent epimerase/dehydratase family protein [Enterococcus casseliflavus]|uniref:NAD-dependent epimerase/dehydratase family protein n=1 Tax=Enterococcus casseliflavus TaxID=37734 RepID=UPI001E5C8488|nr:NAD-dependent epimerase/dehydratase family protein [Enterococcus casseliflavus]MCD4961911.1 NAD-dependent epimerase/dehydratase family protein [Enterococcus casseliflavus]
MKSILITGANSYIGTSFEKWMQQFGGDYQIDTIDMHGEAWKAKDFSAYDSIFHVAGIAHADVSKVNKDTKKLYYKVNCDLAVDTARKYKQDLDGKIGQFIYMSSIIIYGEETSINKKRVITINTKPKPTNFYGDSKLKAEENLIPFNDENFNIVILRPPMIYGEGSKGNYQQLVKLANKMPVFPNIKNERSMLSIDKLCDFLKKIIDNNSSGIYFPQNSDYVRTSHMVKEIATVHGKNIILFSGLNWFIYLFGYFPGKIGKLTNKAFGNLTYENADMEIKL